jgi:hypothetical protein
VAKIIYQGARFRVEAWANGSHCELEEFLAKLMGSSYTKWKRICSLIRRMGDKGPPQNEEQCRLIEDNLFQLITCDGVSVFWFNARNNIIICTHGFLIANNKNLNTEIEKAKSLRDRHQEEEANDTLKQNENQLRFYRNV